MTFLKLAFIIILFPVTAFAQDAVGTWRSEPTERGHIEIEIAPCGAALCGTIRRAISTAGEESPYEHLGKRMIWDMQPDGAGQWSGGQIWDPRNGRTYSSKMERRGANLSVSGCVLGICQSQVWRPVN